MRKAVSCNMERRQLLTQHFFCGSVLQVFELSSKNFSLSQAFRYWPGERHKFSFFFARCSPRRCPIFCAFPDYLNATNRLATMVHAASCNTLTVDFHFTVMISPRHTWPDVLKSEAMVQIYVTVLNIGFEIQNSGENVISFLKINCYEI